MTNVLMCLSQRPGQRGYPAHLYEQWEADRTPEAAGVRVQGQGLSGGFSWPLRSLVLFLRALLFTFICGRSVILYRCFRWIGRWVVEACGEGKIEMVMGLKWTHMGLLPRSSTSSSSIVTLVSSCVGASGG